MGKASDHERVDDIGRHPAKLAEGEGSAKAGGVLDFAREGLGLAGLIGPVEGAQ